MSSLTIRPLQVTTHTGVPLNRAAMRAPKISLVAQGKRPRRRLSVSARAASVNTKFVPPKHGFDYYELLGVAADAEPTEIRRSFRWLHKRCHPDVNENSELGHDMAVLLNEAYAVLSHADLRKQYDQHRALTLQDDEYTGQTLFSSWAGAEVEDRAVFVDELSCVGCLKCALLAPDTFSIEAKHGRARAVRQWGNHEDAIYDAVNACPVSCIKQVERSKLPALEFILSRIPRISVGVDVHADGTARGTDIFAEADRFLEKREKRLKNKGQQVQESALQREARIAAAAAIQERAGYWWHRWAGSVHESGPLHGAASLVHVPRAASDEAGMPPFASAARHIYWETGVEEEDAQNLRLLREAAAARRMGGGGGATQRTRGGQAPEEYWDPTENARWVSREATAAPVDSPILTPEDHPLQTVSISSDLFKTRDMSPWESVQGVLGAVPVMAAAAAAMFVFSSPDGAARLSPLDSPLPSEITQGVMGRAVMAAFAWYLLAAVGTGVAVMTSMFISGDLNKKDSQEDADPPSN